MEMHNKSDIVVLEIFNDFSEAGAAQEKLKEAGIESFLQDENVVGLNPIGGVELKIFATDIQAAKKILAKA
jgi:hypothetical protein